MKNMYYHTGGKSIWSGGFGYGALFFWVFDYNLRFYTQLLGCVVVGLVGNYIGYNTAANTYLFVPELFLLLIATTCLITTTCLLTSCLLSISTATIIAKTMFVSGCWWGAARTGGPSPCVDCPLIRNWSITESASLFTWHRRPISLRWCRTSTPASIIIMPWLQLGWVNSLVFFFFSLSLCFVGQSSSPIPADAIRWRSFTYPKASSTCVRPLTTWSPLLVAITAIRWPSTATIIRYSPRWVNHWPSAKHEWLKNGMADRLASPRLRGRRVVNHRLETRRPHPIAVGSRNRGWCKIRLPWTERIWFAIRRP